MPYRKNRRSKKFKKCLDENKNKSFQSDNGNGEIGKSKNELLSECVTSSSPVIETGKIEETGPSYCNKMFTRKAIYKCHMEKCSHKSMDDTETNKGIENKHLEVISDSLITSAIESNNVKECVKSKEIIIASNSNTFYRCKCTKIFRREATYKSHIKKCTNNNLQPKINLNITNNDKTDFLDQYVSKVCTKKITNIPHIEENASHKLNLSNIEHSPSDSQYISDTLPNGSISEHVNGSLPKKAKYDLSVYDFDEEDSDETLKVNTDTKCKLCEFTAETPIDLLKHKREVHKVQRKILPPHEIQKYFDYPDRTFCPICEQPIKSRNFKSIFVKHLLVHTSGLTYECRICKKKFRRIDHMKAHEKRHILTFSELQALQDNVDNTPVDVPFILSN